MRISREGNLVTLINVFETKPEQQQALIDAWLRFVESVKEEQGECIVWQSSIESMLSCASTTP